MPLADALAVWTEEGRVDERENNGKSSTRHYKPLVSEWGNPSCRNAGELRAIGAGNLGN